MTQDQEKYLLKRIDNIEKRKINKITNGNDFILDRTYSPLLTLEYVVERLSQMEDPYNFKMKCKFIPSELFKIIWKHPHCADKVLFDIINFSELEKDFKKKYNEIKEKISELDNIKLKLKKKIILGNDCDEILKMIEDFENMEI